MTVNGSLLSEMKYVFVCPNPPLLKTPSSLYVYTDIIDLERVGDTMAPLLRTIPIEDTTKDSMLVSHTFHRVYYKRVNRNTISSILMELHDDRGDEIKFESGLVIAVLHFRKVSI